MVLNHFACILDTHPLVTTNIWYYKNRVTKSQCEFKLPDNLIWEMGIIIKNQKPI